MTKCSPKIGWKQNMIYAEFAKKNQVIYFDYIEKRWPIFYAY